MESRDAAFGCLTITFVPDYAAGKYAKKVSVIRQLRRASKISNPLSGIKKLAGQTIWYGMSSIFGRFL
ncbi:MAG: hypothetical protein AAB221_08445, partial [Bacteroidota bacterium]